MQVYVKEGEGEEEEEEEENCILKLPDGTVHTLSGVESPSHARLTLPTITETVFHSFHSIFDWRKVYRKLEDLVRYQYFNNISVSFNKINPAGC